ncbi:hypothetical protein [Streptomyces sp. NPDC048496]|uniref:hypothetical protein n=1 Tax=Streptomyces sp. NPDC048496 TaxID=3365558 RepID=UPI0037170B7E
MNIATGDDGTRYATEGARKLPDGTGDLAVLVLCGEDAPHSRRHRQHHRHGHPLPPCPAARSLNPCPGAPHHPGRHRTVTARK